MSINDVLYHQDMHEEEAIVAITVVATVIALNQYTTTEQDVERFLQNFNLVIITLFFTMLEWCYEKTPLPGSWKNCQRTCSKTGLLLGVTAVPSTHYLSEQNNI